MTMATDSLGIEHYFGTVEDPRIDRTKPHRLMDILFISVAATIAGADGPSDIADFARQQLAWCRKFVSLENGVPSHDTIGRVLSLIKPDQFQTAFLDWIASFCCQPQEASHDDDGPEQPPFLGHRRRRMEAREDCGRRRNVLPTTPSRVTQAIDADGLAKKV